MNADDPLSVYSGKHVCIVYQYISDSSPDIVWYHQWGLNVLSYLGGGFESIGLALKIVDIETFLKCPREVLLNVDYSLNLICGNMDVANWGLVPSLSSWYKVAPMPNRAESILAGERKDTANLIAERSGLRVPEWGLSPSSLETETNPIVKKPRDFGSSEGLEIISSSTQINDCENSTRVIYQKFISGIDVTIPVIFDPFRNQHILGDAVAFVPSSGDADWILDAPAKSINRLGSKLALITKTHYCPPPELIEPIRRIIRLMGGSSVARVDFRVSIAPGQKIEECGADRYNFIEINPVPTMNVNSDYAGGIASALKNKNSDLYRLAINLGIDVEKQEASATITAFSMLSYADITSIENG